MASMYDVCVVGAGLFGSSAAKYIVTLSPSLKVLLIGPREPTDRGSSEIFGAHYDEGRVATYVDSYPTWATLSLRSIKSYKTIEKESGLDFFTEVGSLDIDTNGSGYISDCSSVAKQIQEKVVNLDADELKVKWPFLNFGPNVEGLYTDANAGYINPRLLLKAQKIIAEKNGCDILDSIVEDIEETGDGTMMVTTETGRKIKVKKVLVAAGGFSAFKNLLPSSLKPSLINYSVMALHVEIDSQNLKQLKDMPVVSNVNREPQIVDNQIQDLTTYILPPIEYPDGKVYIKIGHADLYSKNLQTHKEFIEWYRHGDNPRIQEILKVAFRTYFPSLPLVNFKYDCCVTSHTVNEQVYAEMQRPNLGVLFGGCGQGAMCCDEIGKMGARMVVSGKWDYDLPQELFKYHTVNEESV